MISFVGSLRDRSLVGALKSPGSEKFLFLSYCLPAIVCTSAHLKDAALRVKSALEDYFPVVLFAS